VRIDAMKRLVIICLAVLCALAFSSGAQGVQQTLTFDEIEAWNATPAGGGKWIGEEFASMGVHFLGNFMAVVGDNNYDGVVYDSGMLAGIPGISGQYLGVASVHPDGGTGNAGLVIQFDEKQTLVTMQVQAVNGATSFFWLFDTDIGTGLGQELVFSSWTVPSGWSTVTFGDGSTEFDYILVPFSLGGTQTAAIDNITFEAPTPPPTADFTLTPASGTVPLTVSFTDQSTNAASWQWDFGNGMTFDGQAPPPQTYGAAGTYTITLTVSNAAGSDTVTRTLQASDPVAPPTAAFSVDRTEGDAPLNVIFTDESTDAGSWLWDFGDGETSSWRNPTHTYERDGMYTVSLTVSNALGSDTVTKTDLITVTKDQYVLYFPYVQATAPWATKVGMVNINTESNVRGTLRYYDSAGIEVMEEDFFVVQPQARIEVAVFDPAVAYLTFTTGTFGARGYAKISMNGMQRAALPAVEAVSEGDLYMHHIVSDDTWESRLVFLNTTDERKDLVLDVMGATSIMVRVAAHSQRVSTISELFGNQKPVDIRSGVVRNAEGIVAAELFEATNQMFGITLDDDLASTMYYPHVVSTNQWETGIAMYNPQPMPSEATVTSFDADGSELGSSTQSLGSYENYVRTWRTTGWMEGAAWSMVEGGEPLTGFLAYCSKISEQSAGFSTVNMARQKGVFPEIEQDGWTGIGMVNVGDAEAAVTLTAFDNEGNVIAAETLSLGVGAKVVALAQDLFTSDISAATYITFSADQPIAGFQLNGSGDDMMLDGLPAL